MILYFLSQAAAGAFIFCVAKKRTKKGQPKACPIGFPALLNQFGTRRKLAALRHSSCLIQTDFRCSAAQRALQHFPDSGAALKDLVCADE
jgi:hypothetical protein